MSLKEVAPGKNIPEEVNVIIEIPMLANPVKYEIDKETGTLQVDRIMATSMVYPANYGFIPQTLSDDGDPVDVLVVTPIPLVHGCVIKARPVGMLKMTDEAGQDAKVLAVPVNKISQTYLNVKTYKDLPEILLKSIAHFFSHYKDLEDGKWVKIEGWEGVESAHNEILSSVQRYQG